MTAALAAGGSAVGVLADSLLRMLRDRETQRALAEGQLCLVTPYKPSAGFSVPNAMGRNKLIYALSRATLVVTSDKGTGGTWAGAEEALRRKIAPVLVWRGEGVGPGNAALIAKGANAVEDLSEVVAAASVPPPEPEPSQLRFGM
jgi:predicted Rossmann fold nucleotide-binding protein DprA/Smf involved in DNA uptake